MSEITEIWDEVERMNKELGLDYPTEELYKALRLLAAKVEALEKRQPVWERYVDDAPGMHVEHPKRPTPDDGTTIRTGANVLEQRAGPKPTPEAQQDQERTTVKDSIFELTEQLHGLTLEEAFRAGQAASDADLARLRDALRWRNAGKEKPPDTTKVVCFWKDDPMVILSRWSEPENRWMNQALSFSPDYWLPLPPLPQEAQE